MTEEGEVRWSTMSVYNGYVKLGPYPCNAELKELG
jgi:hypothetical protein